MTIDNTPAIKAFCEERIRQINALDLPENGALKARLDELGMIVSLCNGLAKQNELLSRAMSEILPPNERI